MKIYLAGGFRGTVDGMPWQHFVQHRASKPHIYLDPSTHPEMKAVDQYTLWDLAAVRSCDVVLAYMDVDNPAGWALALEIGYAYGLRKPVLLVDKKSEVDERFSRYFAMVREVCVEFSSLEAAIAYIDKFPS